MNKYREAACAAAIDYAKIEDIRCQKAIEENIKKFIAISTRTVRYPSEVAASLREIGKGEIDDRIDKFVKVRGYFAKNQPDNLDIPFKEIELPLFKQIAFFEAVGFEHHNSGSLQIDDERFNHSLKMLFQLSNMNISSKSINLIIEYYKGMDYLLAERFWSRTHRGSRRVRIGPFSVACGQLKPKYIDRPAIVLDSKQKKEFVYRCLKKLSLRYIARNDPRLDPLSKRIPNKPKAVNILLSYPPPDLIGVTK